MRRVLFCLLLLLSLTGCSDKELKEEEKVKLETISCKLINEDPSGYTTSSEYNINYQDKYVNNVVTVETITSDSEEFLNIMKEYVSSIYETSNEKYGGYSYKVERNDNKLIATVKVDYSKLDLITYISDQPEFNNYVQDGKFLVSGAIKIYESYGAICDNNSI